MTLRELHRFSVGNVLDLRVVRKVLVVVVVVDDEIAQLVKCDHVVQQNYFVLLAIRNEALFVNSYQIESDEVVHFPYACDDLFLETRVETGYLSQVLVEVDLEVLIKHLLLLGVLQLLVTLIELSRVLVVVFVHNKLESFESVAA